MDDTKKRQILDALEIATVKYEEQLHKNGPVRDYLHARGFTDATLRRFRVGYAPNAWEFLKSIPTEEWYPPDLLVEAGLLKKRENKAGYYDFFRHRIMFPFQNPEGKVLGFTARALDSEEVAKYINTPQTSVFHKSKLLFGLRTAHEAIRQEKRAIIVEGPTDVMALYQEGRPEAVAPCGTALTVDHLQWLERHSPGLEKLLCFDGDESGRYNAARVVESTFGHDLKPVSLPEKVDPAELMLQGKSIDPYLAKWTDELSFLIESKKANRTWTTTGEYAHLVRLLVPALLQAPDDRREGYLDSLATKIPLSKDALRNLIEGATARTPQRHSPTLGERRFSEAEFSQITFIRRLLRSGPNPASVRYFSTQTNIAAFLTLPEVRTCFDYFAAQLSDPAAMQKELALAETDLFGTAAQATFIDNLSGYSQLNGVTLDKGVMSFILYRRADYFPPTHQDLLSAAARVRLYQSVLPRARDAIGSLHNGSLDLLLCRLEQTIAATLAEVSEPDAREQ